MLCITEVTETFQEMISTKRVAAEKKAIIMLSQPLTEPVIVSATVMTAMADTEQK